MDKKQEKEITVGSVEELEAIVKKLYDGDWQNMMMDLIETNQALIESLEVMTASYNGLKAACMQEGLSWGN